MIESELLRYGYLFVVLGTVLEGDATLLSAAFLAHRGYLHFSWVLGIAGLSTFGASQVYYAIARRAGERLLQSSGSSGPKMQKVLAWSRDHGGLLVLAARFMPGFRTLIPVVCGATRMSPSRFFAWNLAGAALWALTFGFAGDAGGQVMTLLIGDIRRHERVIAALLAMGVAAMILWKTRGRDLADIWMLRRAFRISGLPRH